jgi:hypothetical protein
VLDELLHIGSAVLRADGDVELRREVHIPAADSEGKLVLLGSDTAELFSTIMHNIEDGEAPWLQRKVVYDNIGGDALPVLQEARHPDSTSSGAPTHCWPRTTATAIPTHPPAPLASWSASTSRNPSPPELPMTSRPPMRRRGGPLPDASGETMRSCRPIWLLTCAVIGCGSVSSEGGVTGTGISAIRQRRPDGEGRRSGQTLCRSPPRHHDEFPSITGGTDAEGTFQLDGSFSGAVTLRFAKADDR